MGMPYLVNWGKDNTIMKQIISTYGMDKTKQMIDSYFSMLLTEPFLQKTGAQIGVFKTQIPKILLSLNNEEQDEQAGRL